MIINIVFESGFNFGYEVEGSVNYAPLVAKITELFPHVQIESLQWKDEDGDLITFSSQEELNEAMVNGTEELTVYIQELQNNSPHDNMSLEDTPQQGATEYKLPHRNRFCYKNRRPKRIIGEEIPLDELPEFFSVSKVPRKIKRRFRRLGRKRLLRHRVPAAADCYPHRKTRGRRQSNDLDETLASMSISEDDTKS